MGWQTLSASLRRWDGTTRSREVETAADEVLAGDAEEALQIFSEALDPALARGTDFLHRLSRMKGAKSRCDAVWYGDTIAYGCKTCGLSSASCICVFCFDAGDHEGHDFYISRSDYGCCDCGDSYAWRRSGFCRHHPGPHRDVDPTELLPETTRRRAREVLIPAQVRRLVQFQPNVFPDAPSASGATSSSGACGEGGSTSSTGGAGAAAEADGAGQLPPGGGEGAGDAADLGAQQGGGDAAAAEPGGLGAAGAADDAGGPDGAMTDLPAAAIPPATTGAVAAEAAAAAVAVGMLEAGFAGASPQPPMVLVTGVNLRVTEEQLRDFLVGWASNNGLETAISSVRLVRDTETMASKGRAYVFLRSEACVKTITKVAGEVLRGSQVRIHVGRGAIVAAERHLRSWESHFEWLLNLGGFHDGLRRIIGEAFLNPVVSAAASGEQQPQPSQHQSAVEVLLRHSHLMEPSVRKLETNLMVDLMLDLDFKHRFAQVFTRLYRELVLSRAGNQDTNELGDFTCQIFTREDVTLELVREHDLVRNLLGCLWDLLRPALLVDARPAVFNHESNIFRDHEIIQCSMDLLYVLDHGRVAREIICTPKLRQELWEGWVRILVAMQSMNPHERRTAAHVEFTNASWGNALTLHTDLMSNTWLILDAVESKADVGAVREMARWTWNELQAWLSDFQAAEAAAGAEGQDRFPGYRVSRNAASFHAPVNRVLALLLHHLCLRGERLPAEGTSSAASPASVHATFTAVGLAAHADILQWMEHPLRALVLHSQVSAGMWRRNGEALENESEFYRMNYWHHLLVDVDLLIMRMASMLLPPEAFFTVVLNRFELSVWLQPGDPLAWLSPGTPLEDEFAAPKLQSFILLLYQLLSAYTPLSLTFRQMVVHTTRQYLSIGPKSHSQLWDPRLERSTATTTAKDQQMLEGALREISKFSEADGTGHTSAKYHLKDDQWTAVDPYFHLFSWSEQQKAEENITTALKSRNATLLQWIAESSSSSPQPFAAYRPKFMEFCSCGVVQAVCWLLLVKLSFKHLKDCGAVADGRLLVVTLHLALRSLQTASCDGRGGGAEPFEAGQADGPVPVLLGEDQVQVFAIARAMDSNLSRSARRTFRVSTATFFDPRMHADAASMPSETDICLLDAVMRLCDTPEESISGGLARGLRAKLLQDPGNLSALRTRPRPWFAPPLPESLRADIAESSPPEVSMGGPAAAAASSVPPPPESPFSQDEVRRAKRRRAAQERQQRMLADLKKKQASFMTGAQGQQLIEAASGEGSGGAAAEAPAVAECVVCMSHDDSNPPLGLLCFLRPAAASSLPRHRVPVESAVLLQTQRAPVAGRPHMRGPQTFSPQATDGMVVARACSHQMHFACWQRFRQVGVGNSGGRLSCPYCGGVVNALLPCVLPLTDAPRLDLLPAARPSAAAPQGPEASASGAQATLTAPLSPKPHAESLGDFLEQLGQQTQRLGSAGALPPALVAMLGLQPGAEHKQPLVALARLCADSLALSEVRLRAPRQGSSTGGSASSSAGPDTGLARFIGGVGGGQAASNQAMLRYMVAEAFEDAPDLGSTVVALASSQHLAGALAPAIHEASPHSRFQMLAVLLFALCTTPAAEMPAATASDAAHSILFGFFLAEVVVVLGSMASESLVESELCAADAASYGPAASLWRLVRAGVAQPSQQPTDLLPLQSRAEAVQVLRLALNQFLAKVHMLLVLLVPRHEVPPLRAPDGVLAMAPHEEHSLLSCPELGLPPIDWLLGIGADVDLDQAAASPVLSRVERVLVQWFGDEPRAFPYRGLQPPSPLLVVLVSDDDVPAGSDGQPLEGEGASREYPLPPHVWQVSSAGFDRLVASNPREVVELGAGTGFGQHSGRLLCCGYRMTLPVVTGRIYQKFYTQFVHARCAVCRSSPPIPTLCLLCGTFLCCNSECCRRQDADGGQALGEVTVHSQLCGFGTCVFLQLTNSLVHIVADGFIACWGSLYLDGHGEEEYNLSRPLHISEARLQQLTASLREVTFDFESRLKWKKVIFV